MLRSCLQSLFAAAFIDSTIQRYMHSKTNFSQQLKGLYFALNSPSIH